MITVAAERRMATGTAAFAIARCLSWLAGRCSRFPSRARYHGSSIQLATARVGKPRRESFDGSLRRGLAHHHIDESVCLRQTPCAAS